jgi:hypothetical protein
MREYLKYLGPKGGVWSFSFWWCVFLGALPIFFHYYSAWFSYWMTK